MAPRLNPVRLWRPAQPGRASFLFLDHARKHFNIPMEMIDNALVSLKLRREFHIISTGSRRCVEFKKSDLLVTRRASFQRLRFSRYRNDFNREISVVSADFHRLFGQPCQSASEHFDAAGDPLRTRVFIWAMAYAVMAGNENHGYRSEAGDKKRVVVGAADHASAA